MDTRSAIVLYVAFAPCHGAFFVLANYGCTCVGLVGLAFNTQIHDVIPADSTVFYLNVPGPQGHGIPLKEEQELDKELMR